jgi:hypothetical protein
MKLLQKAISYHVSLIKRREKMHLLRMKEIRFFGMGMVMTLILGILGYPATALSVEDETESQEIADTKYGLVQGRTEDGVVVFKGIPYAKAPVGNLRFHSPEEPDEWDGVNLGLIFVGQKLEVLRSSF